jgi:hypothetical protein
MYTARRCSVAVGSSPLLFERHLWHEVRPPEADVRQVFPAGAAAIFEAMDSERGIAWRRANSPALRGFLRPES